MRKLFTALFILGAFLVLGPRHVYAGAGGSMPTFYNNSLKLWKSSTTNTQFSALFTSGTIVIHQVIVGSNTVNNPNSSFVSMVTSTDSNFNVNQTTIVFMNLDSDTSKSTPPQWFDILAYSYCQVNHQGIASVTILWDWFDTLLANPRGDQQ